MSLNRNRSAAPARRTHSRAGRSRRGTHPAAGVDVPTVPGWRRLAAFAVDYLLIAIYLVLLGGVGGALRRRTGMALEAPRTRRGRLLGQAMSAGALTLPVALYFALNEAAPGQATPGKRALGLRVVGTATAGGRLPLRRSLLRSAVKLAPWEVAHAALWQTPGWPARPEPGAATVTGAALALLGAAWYTACLFTGDRRTPYDRAAGSRVVEA
jgi:uncharacterized RDD family membrane protein YckC